MVGMVVDVDDDAIFSSNCARYKSPSSDPNDCLSPFWLAPVLLLSSLITKLLLLLRDDEADAITSSDSTQKGCGGH